eukprot:scaffold13594_cov66-Phaeocystis_antarctica.AAC.1
MPRVRATRTSLPRAVRTRGAQGSLCPGRGTTACRNQLQPCRTHAHRVAPHRWPSSCCATQSTSSFRRSAFYRVS